MAKEHLTVRLDGNAREALDRLCAFHGYPTATEAVEDALVRLGRDLAEAGSAVAQRFSPEEWNLLADCSARKSWEPGKPSGPALALEASEGHRLESWGYRWFLPPEQAELAETEPRMIPLADRQSADRQVARLCGRLESLSAREAIAVARACCWFNQRKDDPRVQFDCRWWEPSVRESMPPLEDA